jgi:uncharacterized membrane protein
MRTAIRVTSLGHAVYAVSLAAFGGLLLSGTFVYVYAPLPLWMPGREVLAALFGATMLVAAVFLFSPRFALRSSAVLAYLFLAWLLLIQVPRIIDAPSKELLWSGAAQLLSLIAGAWLLFVSFAAPSEGEGRWGWLRGRRATRIALVMYGVALPMFGLHHFLATRSPEAVPAWLPFRPALAYLTGVFHIAAGLAILVGIVPRLAAKLEAIMISVFVVLVHVAGVINAPADALQWTMLIDASAIGGAAWIVASCFRRSG